MIGFIAEAAATCDEIKIHETTVRGMTIVLSIAAVIIVAICAWAYVKSSEEVKR